MSALISDMLQKLDQLKSTNLGNLGLVGSDMDENNQISLSGVIRDDTGDLVFVEADGSTTKIATVDATTGFSRFVFDVEGAFPLIADSAKDAVNLHAGDGIKIQTDPSTDTMIFSVDPTTFLTTVGTGASILNPLGELRTIVALDNLSILETPEELQLSVQLDPVDVGIGEVSLHAGADPTTGKPALRTLTATPTVKYQVTNDTLEIQAIPNLENLGAGQPLSSVDADGVGQINTLSAGANMQIMLETDGSYTLSSSQSYNQIGAGSGIIATNTGGFWEIRTLKAGAHVDIQPDSDGALVFRADTDVVSTGGGVPLGFSEYGIGKIRSIKAGPGISITQNALDIEMSANMRVQDSGDGTSLATVEADGSLSLKTIKPADSSIIITDDNGGLALQANPDDYMANATLGTALDGSGDDKHLIIDTNRGTTIDAGPIPYIKAYNVAATDSNGDPITEIHIYNRASFVGKLPLDHPQNDWVASVEGDLQNDLAGVEMWDSGDDWSDPPNQVIHIDLEL